VLETRLVLLAPFVPFLANELYEQMTGMPAEEADWPAVDPEFQSPQIEAEEELVRALVDDIGEVIDVTGTDPSTIRIYTGADWKYRAFGVVAETGPDIGEAMSQAMQYDSIRSRSDEAADLVEELVEFVRERPVEQLGWLGDIEEHEVYEEAARFLGAEFDAEIEIYQEGPDVYDPADKAANAVPFRPAIHLE
jgi:leucyl-tRNA synthetase